MTTGPIQALLRGGVRAPTFVAVEGCKVERLREEAHKTFPPSVVSSPQAVLVLRTRRGTLPETS